jgi:hypothetical protein
MRKNITLKAAAVFLLLTGTCIHSFGQNADDKSDKLAVTLNLNHDAFFGFNPALNLSYPLSSKTDLTFYGIQWGAGTASAWGNWTEFGFGANFKTGNFGINPQLGFTKGSLLSSGATNPGIIGDGIVPNLTVNFDNSRFLGQLYSGYYGALRNRTNSATQATNNYVHYWINGGVKATSWMSFGIHYEHLFLSGGNRFEGGSLARTNGYKWFGPFLQVAKKAAGLRLSLGRDVDEGEGTFSRSDFYKLSFFANF